MSIRYIVLAIIIGIICSWISSCGCAKADTTCLMKRVSFTIIYNEVDVFDRSEGFSTDSVLIYNEIQGGDPISLSINDRSYTLDNISETTPYFVEINGIAHPLNVVYSEDNFDCCNGGGIIQIEFMGNSICEGLSVSQASCAFNDVLTLRVGR